MWPGEGLDALHTEANYIVFATVICHILYSTQAVPSRKEIPQQTQTAFKVW